MINRLIQFLKPRWPLVALVLTTPLLIAGTFAWMTSDDSTTPAPRRQVQPATELGTPNLSPSVEIDRSLDRGLQREQVQAEVEKRRATTPLDRVALGQALLQLGKLEQALVNPESAGAAFDEVQTLHDDPLHWQSHEALLRNDVLVKLGQASPADRKTWQQAADRFDEAGTLHLAGHFQESLERAEEALTMRRRLWGDEHAETAESLLQLAWFSIEHVDSYGRAESLAREAADRVKAAWGETHPLYGDCIALVATLADGRGEFDGADHLYEQALAIYRHAKGELSREFARTLNRQGRMHNTWWKDYGTGKSFTALQIREAILDPEHPDRAESLEDLAEAAFSLRDFARAGKLLGQALDVRIRRQGSEHPDLARPQSLLAACHAEEGDVSQGLVNIHRALALTERWRGAKHPLWAQQKYLMGVMQRRSAFDYAGGYRLLEQSAQALRELGLQHHPLYCEAIVEQSEALRADVFMSLNEDPSPLLGLARERTQEAIDGFQALPGGERFGSYAEALIGLHEVSYFENYKSDEPDAVRKLLTEIERVVNANGGPYHPAYAYVPHEWGRFSMSHGDYDSALPRFERHIKRIEKQYGHTHPWFYGSALQSLTGVLIHQGTDMERARQTAIQSFDIFFSQLWRNASGQSDVSRLAALRECHAQMSTNLCVGQHQDNLAAVYDKVLAVRGMATSFQTSDRVAHDHLELQFGLEAVRQARRSLQAVAFSTDPKESEAEWVERFQDVSDKKELAENELAVATRPFLPPDTDLRYTQLQSLLEPDTAFIDFVQYDHNASPPNHRGRLVRSQRMLAYLVKDKGPPICVVLGPSREIEQAVTNWRKAIAASQTGNFSKVGPATEVLADLVWKPLISRLPKIKHLYIAPDGPVCFVSFAAMPGRSRDRYALEDLSIGYVNSGRMLYQQLQKKTAATGEGLLLLGDIEYQRTNPVIAATKPHAPTRAGILPNPADWQNLEGTKDEITQVASLFSEQATGAPRTLVLSGRQANAAALEAALAKNWRCIHFAGHGFFIDPQNAPTLAGRFQQNVGQSGGEMQRNQLLLSGLVLAPLTGQPAFPTILTAESLGSLDLRRTDLVVLSACETGLGCTVGADGVLGLTRAFLTAGSRTVVSSLWKVDDIATSLLMEEFYRNLWTLGLPKGEALRRAQLAILGVPGQDSERAVYLAQSLRRIRGF